MNRIQWLVKGLALSLIFVGLGGVSLTQERPREPQDGPRTSMIDELWRQMGQLQRQIVGLEVGDANPRATLRAEPAPGNSIQPLLREVIRRDFPAVREPAPANSAQPLLAANPPQKTSEGKFGDLQRPEPAQKTVPELEKPPKLRDSTNAAQIDQLWRQITELQKAILKLEIADVNPPLLASATLAANGNGRTERPDTVSTRNPDRTSSNGQKREFPQNSLPAQQKPLEPRGGPNEAQIAQHWQQICQLYKQIVALEIGDPRSL